MNNEFIQNVTYDNYDDSQHDNSYFNKLFYFLLPT
jgi:hypothetical protein